ncbi:MAG TPA: hypothetical protein GX014_00740 [Firmicutes bacterium]|jgi:hypothetical protein|nr:hypothetical protein [Bacillota bacterium]HHT41916.1 hypothetical protein [Bacillota bacterium]
MKLSKAAAILLLLLIGSAAASAQGSEFTRTFLLETGARYEVSVRIRTDLQDAPTLASVYIHSEHGQYLRSTQLSRSLAGPNEWQQISTIVTAPPGATHATVVFTAPEGVEMEWDEFNIRRVQLDLADEVLIEQGLVYTGLIVDARGLNVRRGMSPKIYSESGQLIYAGVAVSYGFLQEAGIVSYGQELSPELLRRIQPSDTVKVSPLVVKALSVQGSTDTAVVISDDDAQAILDALDVYDFLAEYSVVFLID